MLFAFDVTGAKIVLDIDHADFLDERLADRYCSVVGDSDAVIAGSRYVANRVQLYNTNISIICTGKPASPIYHNLVWHSLTT